MVSVEPVAEGPVGFPVLAAGNFAVVVPLVAALLADVAGPPPGSLLEIVSLRDGYPGNTCCVLVRADANVPALGAGHLGVDGELFEAAFVDVAAGSFPYGVSFSKVPHMANG